MRALASGRSEHTLVPLYAALVEAIADRVDELAAGRAAGGAAPATLRFADERAGAGLGFADLARELSIVRDELNRRCEQDGAGGPREQHLLALAVDGVLVATMERHAQVRERSLRALDRIYGDALDSQGIEDLLRRIAIALTEEVPAVDAAGLFLREHHQLRLCASVGLGEDGQRGFTLPSGAGFAGRVARERRALFVRDASADPEVRHPGVRARGVRALYGVPLLRGDQLLGVMCVGSTTLDEFAVADRELFEALAARVTVALRHEVVRSSAERRARELGESEAELRAANEALRARDERMRLAADITELGTWDWDIESGALEWSDRLRTMVGIPPDAPIDYETFSELLLPDDRAEHHALVASALAGERHGLFVHDHRIVRPGEADERWVTCRGQVWFDGAGRPQRMTGAVLDITDRMRSELRARCLADAGKLLASSLDYRTTLGHVAEMVVPQLADFCVVDVLREDRTLGDHVAVAHRDPALSALLRGMRERFGPASGLLDVIRRREPVLISHVDPDEIRASVRREDHRAILERLDVRSLIVVPLTVRDEGIGALTLVHSCSGRHFGPHDVGLAQELARMASTAIENARLHRESEHAVQLRDRILALVSHDLRTPLTAIDLSGAVLLELPQVKEDRFVAKQLEIIRRNAARMSRLIGDLLDMSSIQSGRLTLELRPCELPALLAECVDPQIAIATERGVTIRTEIALADADLSRCDRDRIHQVIANLVGNAIKFCETGGEVSVRAERHGDEALVCVSDTGPGIAAEDVPHVFELFWKGKAKQRGTGLGLFIARGIVEAHRGRMWVETQPGGGSSFMFTLPLVTGDPGGS